MIAQWTPQRILTSLLPLEKSAPSAKPTPPAAETVTADAAPPQPAVPAQAAPQPATPVQAEPQAIVPSAAEPSVEFAQSLSAMAHDLANAGQEIEQLKASIQQLKGSIEQLTAGQQQISRDIAKASEPNLRPKVLPRPRRPAVARERRPPPLSRPQATLAPMSTQAAAPYIPRRPEPPPQDTGTVEPQADPQLASVPRPPMPLR